jgi:predicted Zn-dependent protease
MFFRFGIAILLMVLGISGCKKSDTIYLVPIGSAPMAEITDLAAHYRAKFGVNVTVLPQLDPVYGDYDGEREQLIAEKITQTLLRTYSDYRNKKTDVIIGITGQDMYPKSEDWAFCFGWRDQDGRAAVASTARMDSEATLRNRLRKVVTKDIGILYYDKPQSENPKSVLYSGIMGIQELDLVSEDF